MYHSIKFAFLLGFASSKARTCGDKTAIRSTITAEIVACKRGRERKGLKVFQKHRLLENPNNVPPTPTMTSVVSDIKDVLNQQILV